MATQDSALIEEIKEALQHDDLSSLEGAQATNFLKQVEDDKLDQSHVDALIKCYPQTVQVLSKALGTLEKVSDKAGDEGIEALKSVHKCIDTFNSLANQPNLSDETIRQISRDTHESVRELKEINKDNKSFWKRVVGGVVTVVVVGAVVVWKKVSGDDS